MERCAKRRLPGEKTGLTENRGPGRPLAGGWAPPGLRLYIIMIYYVIHPAERRRARSACRFLPTSRRIDQQKRPPELVQIPEPARRFKFRSGSRFPGSGAIPPTVRRSARGRLSLYLLQSSSLYIIYNNKGNV